jgi:hypothetical protein
VHQRLQVLACAGDELAADRRLRGRARLGLELLADRLPDALVAARRDAGQHPLQHRLRQPVAVGEVRIRRKRQLALTIGAAHPRPLDSDSAAAECHLAGLVAVAHRRAVGIVFPLRSDDLADLLFHQLGQNTEADPNAEREQPLPRSADKLPQRLLHPHRQHSIRSRHSLPERYGCLLHGGSSLDLGRIASNAPKRSRRGRRDRRQVLRATGQPRSSRSRHSMPRRPRRQVRQAVQPVAPLNSCMTPRRRDGGPPARRRLRARPAPARRWRDDGVSTQSTTGPFERHAPRPTPPAHRHLRRQRAALHRPTRPRHSHRNPREIQPTPNQRHRRWHPSRRSTPHLPTVLPGRLGPKPPNRRQGPRPRARQRHHQPPQRRNPLHKRRRRRHNHHGHPPHSPTRRPPHTHHRRPPRRDPIDVAARGSLAVSRASMSSLHVGAVAICTGIDVPSAIDGVHPDATTFQHRRRYGKAVRTSQRESCKGSSRSPSARNERRWSSISASGFLRVRIGVDGPVTN